MHLYNVKQNLKDKFYGVPTVSYGSVEQDARALAFMAQTTMNTRATNDKRYWYYFINNVTNRDVIRFLMKRNGLNPEYHISRYFIEGQPVFRILLRDIASDSKKLYFVNQVNLNYALADLNQSDLARYVDRIKSELSRQKVK